MKKIIINELINSSIEIVWDIFTNPKHIVNWNFSNDSWYCPKAENDLSIGGIFCYTMSSKDGKMSFDFSGTYTEIEKLSLIKYVMGSVNENNIDNGRKVEITFEQKANGILITETFDAEDANSIELQRTGWKSILSNFKAYIEK